MADAPEGAEAEAAAAEGAEAPPEAEAEPPPPPPKPAPQPYGSFSLDPEIIFPEGSNPQEILSETFENIMRVGKAYFRTLIRPKDIEVAGDIIRICERINDINDIKAKMYNITFTKFFVKILRWSSLNQPQNLYRRWYARGTGKQQQDALTETRTWLEKDKSYMSLKSFEDGTTLLYAAIASNPQAGWQDGGLKMLEDRWLCNK